MPKNLSPALGSLLMIGLPGTVLDASTIDLITNHAVHNFILFSRNVENPNQLRELCTALRSLCQQNSLPAPLISIDQEGGSVSRLPAPFSQFKDQRQIAEAHNCREGLQNYAVTCARELKDVGINMNLAPVLDVCPPGEGFFMEQRCLGQDPAIVAQHGRLVIQEMQGAGIAACAKHFPGLGKSLPDPHQVLPTVTAGRQELASCDFLPFKAAAEADVAAFMTSHTIYQDLDPVRPATLSPLILKDILRKELGYTGLVITDDLEMGAIEENGAIADAALASFMAGADLLLICHNHQKIRDSINALTKGFEEGQINPNDVKLALSRQEKVRKRFA